MERRTKKANVLFDEIERDIGIIAQYGEEGVDALVPLLDAEDLGVRLWAATHLLGAMEKRATEVLTRIARCESADPLIGFTAEQTLFAWTRGEMKAVFSQN